MAQVGFPPNPLPRVDIGPFCNRMGARSMGAARAAGDRQPPPHHNPLWGSLLKLPLINSLGGLLTRATGILW